MTRKWFLVELLSPSVWSAAQLFDDMSADDYGIEAVSEIPEHMAYAIEQALDCQQRTEELDATEIRMLFGDESENEPD